MSGLLILFGLVALLGVGAYAQFGTGTKTRRAKRRKPRPRNKPFRPGLPVPATANANRSDGRMPFVFDDGGRKAAGYKGKSGDCVTRSVAITTGLPYQQVYDSVNSLAKRERLGTRKRGKSNARDGVYEGTTRKLLESLGWQWTPTMEIGSGCRVHLRASELPPGRLVVSVSGHLTAVVDGVIHNTHDPSRRGTRCVYGYWRPPKPTTKPRSKPTDAKRVV
jgi:hypothetical protein